ncbi:Hypothetical predicted protein [Lecanosticta acicola]|uniref:Uncharacterized protein n=1 Tax=Lecanosticta acicola TaxID=111012 RepID=A0AAI8Z688_9PEZI|nr:Hypothetical predicted protein [Lecanosticta acicola]
MSMIAGNPLQDFAVLKVQTLIDRYKSAENGVRMWPGIDVGLPWELYQMLGVDVVWNSCHLHQCQW